VGGSEGIDEELAPGRMEEVSVLEKIEVVGSSETVGLGCTVSVKNFVSSDVLSDVEVISGSEGVGVDWIGSVEKVVRSDVLNVVEENGALDDRGEQLLTSAPGPKIGVKSMASMPNQPPESNGPSDATTTILTVCVSPFTTTGTPKGCQLRSVRSSSPPQGTSSKNIWKLTELLKRNGTFAYARQLM
jgi:hypothetical protein